MFNYTDWLITNAFEVIDRNKAELLECTDENDIVVCQGVIKQYQEFLNRVLI